MRANRLREIWHSGRAAVNGWLTIPSPVVAELFAHQGFDSLTIDMQHGLIDYQVMLGMLQAISTTDTVPIVRVPWNEPGIIMKALDAGAYGIICPLVNSRVEAEAFVRACRYPPAGFRSYGPTRAVLYGGADYADHADATVVTIAMVETALALADLDAILSTPGLDAIYVGPADLTISLGGRQRVDVTEPRTLEAIEQVAEACRRWGVVAGIHCASAEYARRMIALGYQFTTVLADMNAIVASARATLTAMHEDRSGS